MELVVEGVSKTYDDLLVLNQIDLTADEGQIVCIIGPSGCGKSTLLRLMGGLRSQVRAISKRGGHPPRIA